MASDTTEPTTAENSPENPTWTYPTRFCRICREDVPPTVTMYPPGVPPRFQRPVVEYKNQDEYGRLMRPCKCTGSMRYIHELCLLRSRTETRREGSMWKCHTCGYRFNFQKLAIQRFLSSRYASGTLTVLFMMVLMFFLGFVADPIINLYVDPYETLLGDQDVWDEVKMHTEAEAAVASWGQHFVKGLISMGLMGFIKTFLLNPLNWLNIRHNLGMSSARTTQTGRDRAINISWVAVLIGVVSAFYFFYQWVQKFIQLSLHRVGNNIVDTKLPGDDDDLKPPPGWKGANENAPATDASDVNKSESNDYSAETLLRKVNEIIGHRQNTENVPQGNTSQTPRPNTDNADVSQGSPNESLASTNVHAGPWANNPVNVGRSSALEGVHEQAWSFAGI